MNTLKKILVALAVVLMTAGIAEAKPIAFGIKAGMNINKLKFNKDIASSDNSCGWTAGVMADFTVPIVGLGCDISLMYSRMNNSSDVDYNDNLIAAPNTGLLGSSTLTDPVNQNKLYGQNFLEIPINLKYKFTLPVVEKLVKPYLFTGPSFAFRLDKSITDNINNIKSRTCQVNWNVGLGLELLNHVQVGASYGFGINNVVDKVASDYVSTVGDIKAKNNYWTVSAAYLF